MMVVYRHFYHYIQLHVDYICRLQQTTLIFYYAKYSFKVKSLVGILTSSSDGAGSPQKQHGTVSMSILVKAYSYLIS